MLKEKRMKRYLFALPLVVVFSFWTAPSAQAAAEDSMDPQNVDFYSSCDSSMSADQCMWSPMGGGNYATCLALGPDNVNPQGQTCQAVIDYDATKQCIAVKRSASCECDSQTFKLSGRCTYVR